MGQLDPLGFWLWKFVCESCSLLKRICSFQSEMTKMLLRDLSHAGVNLN